MLRETLIIIFIAICFAKTVSAQNKGTIKGKVTDSLAGSAIERATVAVVNARDSSLISYTLSTKSGEFALYNVPMNRQLRVIVSYVGYQPFRKIIQLSEQELAMGSIPLSASTLLDEVVIESAPPIRVNKDTIEFNADAFKTRPNAVVEDLLKKLPGIQVDMDGTISMNGKKISKVLVDGKEFFVDDLRIATRNLDASLIQSVQVMDDRGLNADEIKDESKLPKIINLKLKRAIKHSTFGKLYAGGGTRDRFEAGALINMFRDTLQVSFIGFGNNVNRSAFDYSELQDQGGFGRSETSVYGGGIDLGGQAWGSIQRAFSSGININNNFGKKVKANLMYFYGNIRDEQETQSNGRQLLDDNTILNQGSFASRNDRATHNARGLLEWTPDSMRNMRYVPRLSLQDHDRNSTNHGSSANLQQLLNNNSSRNWGNGLNSSFSHELSYYQRLHKKGASFGIRHSLSLNPNRDDSYQQTDIQYLNTGQDDEHIRMLNRNKNNQKSMDVSASLQYPVLKKLSATLSLSGRYETNGEKKGTYQLNEASGNYDLFLDTLSSNLSRDIYAYGATPGLNWKFSDRVNLNMSMETRWQRVSNYFGGLIAPLNRQYFQLLPAMRFTMDEFSISYNTNIRQPWISQLSPITDNRNKLYISSGNPDLKPTRTHSLTIQHNKYFTDQQISIFTYIDGSMEENGVTDLRTLDAGTGAQTSKPVNIDGNYRVYFSGFISKRFKKVEDWNFNTSMQVSANLNRNYYLLNEAKDIQRSYGFDVRPNFSFEWKELLDISPTYRFAWNHSRQPNTGQSKISYHTHEVGLGFRISAPWKLRWEASYSYRYNSQISNSFQRSTNLLNASVYIPLFKQGELKFSVFDLLDQNNGVQSYVYQNYIGDQISSVLKRYFMLGYVFKFNKTVTK